MRRHVPSRPASPANSSMSLRGARARRAYRSPFTHHSHGLVTKLRLKPPSHGPAAGGESSLLGGRAAAATKTASKAETCLNRIDIGFRRCLADQLNDFQKGSAVLDGRAGHILPGI